MRDEFETWGDVVKALAVGILLAFAVIALVYAVAGYM